MGRVEDGAGSPGGLVQQRPENQSGDYAYDLVHEQLGDRGRTPEEWPGGRSGPAPAHRPVELDQDMSYDEAHDF
jgi:hypothetical protein